MKNNVKIALLMGALSLALSACGSPEQIKDATESTLLIQDDKIYSMSIEEFDEVIYSEDDLKDSIKSAISEYQEENGKDSVSQKSFKVDNDIAKLCLEYASLEDYNSFNLIEVSDCELTTFLSTNKDRVSQLEWKNQSAQVVTFEEIENGSGLRVLYGDFAEELAVIIEKHDIVYYGGSVKDAITDTAYVTQEGEAYIIYK
ncbi:MAG: hypothetical protein IJA10_05835 [Lachnospiraceae bacterium]|nr:hypothetical protein [Lachnospiraceae bacterium]